VTDDQRIQSLTDDVDLRMLDLWEFLEEFEDDELRELALRLIRAAYGRGYWDAWSENRPGSLFRDNGYALPPRAEATLVWEA